MATMDFLTHTVYMLFIHGINRIHPKSVHYLKPDYGESM